MGHSPQKPSTVPGNPNHILLSPTRSREVQCFLSDSCMKANNMKPPLIWATSFSEQELYRYAGDTNTSYYKAVKGWQDASKMKNEVRDVNPIDFELRKWSCLLSFSKHRGPLCFSPRRRGTILNLVEIAISGRRTLSWLEFEFKGIAGGNSTTLQPAKLRPTPNIDGRRALQAQSNLQPLMV